ncbi:MAG: DUF4440 domain-containing protein [Parvibaculaceae bacterium]
MTALFPAAAREVAEIHDHFVEVFTGRSRDFSRCEKAFAPGFRMVTPGGRRVGRDEILAALARSRARHDFRITIRDITPLLETGRDVLLHYVEEQYRDGETTRRLSVALFEAAPDTPCGVAWRYLQETWITD